MMPSPPSLIEGLFAPLLAGGNLRDRSIACLGTVVAISFIWITSAQVSSTHLPVLIAPIGACAVLLFAIPASPLAQPWPIIGGNTISALTGMAIAQTVHQPMIAATVAVPVAILIMSLLRCLHPPGGAIALGAVLGGYTLSAHLDTFLLPVVLNSALLVFIGCIFHHYSGHSYPHRAVPLVWSMVEPVAQPAFLIEDIDAALADLGETFDVSREDLALLFAQVEAHASARHKAAA